MQSSAERSTLYKGDAGYVRLEKVIRGTKSGTLLRYSNPDPKKLHAVDSTGMAELEQAVAILEDNKEELDFCVFYGDYDPIHAGADITEFSGDCDYAAIDRHLLRGTDLDIRVKHLWPYLNTVSIVCGDRYGGSVEWPLFAERIVCDQHTRLQFSEVHLGIVPGWNGVLNVFLKSNAANAAYMGLTGNPVGAHQLRKANLVQAVINTPEPPDRREIPPETWPAMWAAHAGQCQHMLINAALELAVRDEDHLNGSEFELATAAELDELVTARMNPAAYAALREEIAAQLADLGDAPDKEDLKALTKEINKRLAELGKPLAPAAVGGLRELFAKWRTMTFGELVGSFPAEAHAEAKLCGDLMHTEHRRRGINAVLSRNPVDRVPVFD
ncbi:hypothetical protein JW859_09760 [bacterium]|nr:hypothetical protein [bacterium]